MKNSTLACKVLLTAFTIFSLNFTTVAAPFTSAPVEETIKSSIKFEFASIAPGISATVTKTVTSTSTGNNKSLNIQWITELEQNETHFEVERSFDNRNFKTIAIVLDGFSTGETQKTFQFKDNAADLKGKKTVYYRLKQLDPNGSGTTTKLLTVTL